MRAKYRLETIHPQPPAALGSSKATSVVASGAAFGSEAAIGTADKQLGPTPLDEAASRADQASMLRSSDLELSHERPAALEKVDVRVASGTRSRQEEVGVASSDFDLSPEQLAALDAIDAAGAYAGEASGAASSDFEISDEQIAALDCIEARHHGHRV